MNNQKKGDDHEPTWHARSMAGKAENVLLGEYQLLKQQGPFARPLFSSNNHSGDKLIMSQEPLIVKRVLRALGDVKVPLRQASQRDILQQDAVAGIDGDQRIVARR